ncbi:hypothetical protein [Enterobacter cloacae]|uniref:hypothetical protein n=1 Tax=Enterobacter cloacae TaxID=550 RepID=UPI00300D895D
MNKVMLCFSFIALLSGCAKNTNDLQPSGYFNNGVALNCQNPLLTTSSYISFVNKKYFFDSNKKVESVYDMERNTQYENNRVLPLQCKGKFSMSDGSILNFSEQISVREVNMPFVDFLSYEIDPHDEEKKSEVFDTALNSLPIQNCRDLMNKVRKTYGRAPLCLPTISNNGTDITSLSGMVGLSDDMNPKNVYFSISIQSGQLQDQYSYNEDELDQLVSLMKLQGKGLTENQSAIVNLKETIKKLDLGLQQGIIDKNRHDEGVSNLKKEISRFENN